MTDIVERLREAYDQRSGAGHWDMLREAAAEIERLRAMLDGCHLAYDTQYAEIEQLRKAYDSPGAEMGTMREVLANTQGWNEKATAEIEQLKERNDVLEIAHQQTHKTLDNAYARVEQLVEQAGEMQLCLCNRDAQIKELKNDIEYLRTVNERLQASNARLLEALKELLRFTENLCADVGVSKYYPSAKQARVAIAKAEGKS